MRAFAAVSNLLQNAFKFTLLGTTVKLRAIPTSDRVRIEVEDECGALPPGPPEGLLEPFVQKDRDRSGLGLGAVDLREGRDPAPPRETSYLPA